MKEEEMKTRLEVFVCQKDDCASRGSKDLADKLKKWAKENHGKEIKVFRSGCMGKCSEGIALAIYPEKKFLLEVREDDAKEIKQSLIEALERIKAE